MAPAGDGGASALAALQALARARPAAPLWLRVQPLLPSFTARLLFAARSGVAMAGVLAAIALLPTGILANNFFALYCGILAVSASLGGAVRVAARMVVAAGAGAAVNAAVVVGSAAAGTGPPSLALALVVVAAVTATAAYLEISPPARRIAPLMVLLGTFSAWQRVSNSGGADEVIIDSDYVLGLWLGVLFGCAAALAAALLPLPVFATARREAASRVRLAALALQRQLAALVLAYLHSGRDEAAAADALAVAMAAAPPSPPLLPPPPPATAASGTAVEPSVLRSDAAEHAEVARTQLAAVAGAQDDLLAEPLHLLHVAARWLGWRPPQQPWTTRLGTWVVALHALRRLLQAMASSEAGVRQASALRAPLVAALCTPAARLAHASVTLLEVSLVGSLDLDGEGAEATRATTAAAAAAVSAEITHLLEAHAASRESLLDGLGTLHHSAQVSDAVPHGAFIFSLLRFARTVLATAEETCPPPPPPTLLPPPPPPPAAVVVDDSQASGKLPSPLTDVEVSASVRSFADVLPSSLREISAPPPPPTVAESAVQQSSASASSSSMAVLDDQPAPALGARLFASSRAVSDYFGLRLSRKQAMRALRTTLAVLLACGLGIAAEHTELLPRGTPIFVFWSPVTVVVCLGDALDAPTYARLSQRMVGTLLGAVFALLLVGLIDETTILCILAAWVVLMSYYRAVGEQSYWAFVSALTAPLLLLVAVPSGAAVASALVVARVLFTAIGLACIIIVYGVLLPVSTRALVCEASHATVVGLRAAAADAVAAHVAGLRTREAAVAAALRLAQAVAAGEPPPPPPPRPPPALDPAAILTELNAVGKSVASLTGLVAMASFEPQLWRTPFPLQERHYAALGVHTRHAAVAARSMLQAATSLAASRRAMPPLLCAAPLRDSPVAAAGSPLPAAVVAALAAVAAGARAADAGALLLVGVAAELDATASAIDEVLALSEILLVPSEQWPWRSATARASAAMRRRRAAAASEALSSAVDAMERALQAKTRAYDRLLGAFAAAVHSDAAAATAAGDAAAAARSMTALRVLATTDALCLSAASFALFDLSTAAAAVAASARRLWHAQEESGSTLFA